MSQQRASSRARRRCGRRRPGSVGLAVDRDADLLAEHLELLDGGGALQVGGDQQRLAALLLSVSASLPAVVVLPRPCRPQSIRTVGRSLAKWKLVIDRPHQLDQLVVDDLDDLLAGSMRREHVLADATSARRGR